MEKTGDQENFLSIVAVDDEVIVHRMLEQIIGNSNLPLKIVGTASSPGEGLSLIEDTYPDICILDIEMGEVSGLQLAEQIMGKLDYRPYIIFLTAHDRFDYAQKAIKVGAMEYVLKPIQQQELIIALKRAVLKAEADKLEKLEREWLRERVESILPRVVADAKSARTPHRSALTRVAQRYVDEHYAEQISLATVAERVNLSPGYLGSIFKAECGMSFRAYLRSVRIARAKELMLDHTMNLTEVALAVGYEDVNYFSQTFLKETGVRPSEYRGSGQRWSK